MRWATPTGSSSSSEQLSWQVLSWRVLRWQGMMEAHLDAAGYTRRAAVPVLSETWLSWQVLTWRVLSWQGAAFGCAELARQALAGAALRRRWGSDACARQALAGAQQQQQQQQSPHSCPRPCSTLHLRSEFELQRPTAPYLPAALACMSSPVSSMPARLARLASAAHWPQHQHSMPRLPSRGGPDSGASLAPPLVVAYAYIPHILLSPGPSPAPVAKPVPSLPGEQLPHRMNKHCLYSSTNTPLPPPPRMHADSLPPWPFSGVFSAECPALLLPAINPPPCWGLPGPPFFYASPRV